MRGRGLGGPFGVRQFEREAFERRLRRVLEDGCELARRLVDLHFARELDENFRFLFFGDYVEHERRGKRVCVLAPQVHGAAQFFFQVRGLDADGADLRRFDAGSGQRGEMVIFEGFAEGAFFRSVEADRFQRAGFETVGRAGAGLQPFGQFERRGAQIGLRLAFRFQRALLRHRHLDRHPGGSARRFGLWLHFDRRIEFEAFATGRLQCRPFLFGRRGFPDGIFFLVPRVTRRGRCERLARRRERQQRRRRRDFGVGATRLTGDPFYITAGAEALPAACVVVALVGWHPPERHATGEDLHRLRGVVDAHGDAVVATCAQRGVQDDGHVVDLKAEAGRLTGRRYQVEHGYDLGVVEERSDRILERYGCDPDRRVFGTGVDVGFAVHPEVEIGALLHGVRIADHVRIADQPGGQLKAQFLLESGRRRLRLGVATVVAQRLVEVERGGELEGVRAGFRVRFEVFVFGRERVRFDAEGRCAFRHDDRRHEGLRRGASAFHADVAVRFGRFTFGLDVNEDFKLFKGSEIVVVGAFDLPFGPGLRLRAEEVFLEFLAVDRREPRRAFILPFDFRDFGHIGWERVEDLDFAGSPVHFRVADVRGVHDHDAFAANRQVRGRGVGFDLPMRRGSRFGKRRRRPGQRDEQGADGCHDEGWDRVPPDAHFPLTRELFCAVFFFAGPYFLRACFSHFTRLAFFLSFLQTLSALASF